MKEQVIRSIGLVVSAAVLGGCIVWAAAKFQPQYEYHQLTYRRNSFQRDDIYQVDRRNGDSVKVASSYVPTPEPTATPTHGFVEESQVAR